MQTTSGLAFSDFVKWEDHNRPYEEGLLHLKALWQQPELNQTGGQWGKRPLPDPYLSVHLGRALERETKESLNNIQELQPNKWRPLWTFAKNLLGLQTSHWSRSQGPENTSMVNSTFRGKVPQISGGRCKTQLVHLEWTLLHWEMLLL